MSAAAMGVLGVCLALAAQVPASAPLPAADAPGVRFAPQQRFTLAWTHSIEKIRWEEDYHVAQDAHGAPQLMLDRARIHGSGAGMDPPPDAVRRGSRYEYVPAMQPDGPLRLTRSEFTPDFDWCVAGACRSLGELLPSDHGVTLLWACRAAKMTP